MEKLDSISIEDISISDVYMLSNTNYNKSEKAVDKCISILERINSKNSKVLRGLEIPSAYFYALKSIYNYFLEEKEKTKQISRLFGIPKKEITGDLTALLNSKGSIKAFVNDFQYDITTTRKAIQNIEIFWGNLYLEKLHDFSKLASLKLVIGDVYTTEGKEVKWLSNINAITGDFYTEDDIFAKQARDILNVRGSIYNTRNGEVVKRYKI